MGKSEYFEVKKVAGEVEQPQIIIDALRTTMATSIMTSSYANTDSSSTN